MLVIVRDPSSTTYLDALRARSDRQPDIVAWDAWGEPRPHARMACICGRGEVRPGEALCPRCDGPE